MKPSKTPTHQVYQIAKQIFEKQISRKDGIEILNIDHNMNKNSAGDYVYNFKCMMEGRKFSRISNSFTVTYYMDQILKDFGKEKLKNAVTALKLHVEYYQNKTGVTQHSMHRIIEKYTNLTE